MKKTIIFEYFFVILVFVLLFLFFKYFFDFGMATDVAKDFLI